eukprot:TRINITY_DN6195_c0_g2_i10.p1 TRINITY_DN6195_c0_g2~~TRINITY_DN6195_c0_g2_i10.p1  ORF type:complete len:122 (-),score=6.52 TRINITY_DN6195_c0_g2_i10:235-600(-)
MKARIMPIQSFTLKDHTALPFPYLPHVQASSSRTGVTRGRVSPCHLFPSSFAFPLGEMPNEGRRRMKIKLDKPHGVLSRAERRPMECFRGQNVDPVWRRCARRTTAPGSRYRLRYLIFLFL